MPRPHSARQPSYLQHKGSGQAVVTIYGRDFYLGRYGTAESKKAYKRLMLEWLANDGMPTPPPAQDLTVSELAAAYKAYAKRYYVRDGKPTEMYQNVRYLMRFLGRSPYGTTRAIEFGPLALKSLRGLMITSRAVSRLYPRVFTGNTLRYAERRGRTQRSRLCTEGATRSTR